MDKDARARLIIDQVLKMNDSHGRKAPPRSPQSAAMTRIISDDCRWEVRLSKDYQKDSSGQSWDLFELSVYGQARMTAAIRGEEIELRYYVPGKWEPIFTILDSFDTVPLLPN